MSDLVPPSEDPNYEPLPDDENYGHALAMLDRLATADTDHLEELDEGPCDQCDREFARARVKLGTFVLCRECARQRVRLAARLKDAA